MIMPARMAPIQFVKRHGAIEIDVRRALAILLATVVENIHYRVVFVRVDFGGYTLGIAL
jgi:hypothetical protein